MFIILVSLYFVKDKRYEHSLIIYWTALVLCSFFNKPSPSSSSSFHGEGLKNTKNSLFWMSAAFWCSTCFCVVLCVGFCTGHFVMVPLNLTCLHCLQHSFFEHLFNLYYLSVYMSGVAGAGGGGWRWGSGAGGAATPGRPRRHPLWDWWGASLIVLMSIIW